MSAFQLNKRLFEHYDEALKHTRDASAAAILVLADVIATEVTTPDLSSVVEAIQEVAEKVDSVAGCIPETGGISESFSDAAEKISFAIISK